MTGACCTLGLQPERVDAYRSGTVRFPSVRVTDATIIDLFGPPMHGANAGGGANLNHLYVRDPDGNVVELRTYGR